MKQEGVEVELRKNSPSNVVVNTLGTSETVVEEPNVETVTFEQVPGVGL